jgi:hypothetical protein
MFSVIKFLFSVAVVALLKFYDDKMELFWEKRINFFFDKSYSPVSIPRAEEAARSLFSLAVSFSDYYECLSVSGLFLKLVF